MFFLPRLSFSLICLSFICPHGITKLTLILNSVHQDEGYKSQKGNINIATRRLRQDSKSKSPIKQELSFRKCSFRIKSNSVNCFLIYILLLLDQIVLFLVDVSSWWRSLPWSAAEFHHKGKRYSKLGGYLGVPKTDGLSWQKCVCWVCCLPSTSATDSFRAVLERMLRGMAPSASPVTIHRIWQFSAQI